MRHLALLAALALSLGAAACHKAAAAAAETVAITISPTTTQTVIAGGTIAFTANVSNTSNTAVTWEVGLTAGGDITVGTISTAGLYTAPSNPINSFTTTVTAVSSADATKTASTTVDVQLPPVVAISPVSPTVAAGASQQFKATLTQNGAVTWYVNGVLGGNATFGTITQAGQYVAPQLPPPGGPVSIEAALQSDNTKFALAAATVTYSNFSLQNAYGFSLRGSDPSGALLRAGSFTADGGGTITAGIEDINNGGNLVQSAVTFTGTYSIGGDGLGTITFNDPFNGNTAGMQGSHFSVAIVSAQQVQLEETDTFATASGEADLQDPNSFNSAAFAGEYTFDFSGVDAAQKPISSVGEFLADGTGGGVSQPALEDTNDNGALASNVSTTFSFQSIGAGGRGLATLNGANFSFYMISAARADFIALGDTPMAVGVALKQPVSGAFSAASLGGNALLFTTGSNAAGPIATATTFFADGIHSTLNSGVLNQNNNGSVSGGSFTGTYAVASTGRGTATFSSGQTYLFYVIGVNQAVFQETDNSIVSDGMLTGQPGGLATSNLSGGYALQLTGISAGHGEQDVVGEINTFVGNTGLGLVAGGTADVNTATSGSQPAFTLAKGVAIPSGSTYAIANSQGTLNLTINGTMTQFAAYFISSNSLLLLRLDTADARVLHGNLFQNVSLAPAITSPNAAAFLTGAASAFTVVATGFPAPTLSETGTLPSGIAFDATTGVLNGIPATGTAGTYSLQFTASNGVGSNAVQNFTLTIM